MLTIVTGASVVAAGPASANPITAAQPHRFNRMLAGDPYLVAATA